MTFHVIAVPTDEDGCLAGEIIGTATSEAEAVKICEAEGYTVIRDGGNVETYDAEDAPAVYGYTPDGFGAIGVTVEIQS